jgi:hypothetical protein
LTPRWAQHPTHDALEGAIPLDKALSRLLDQFRLRHRQRDRLPPFVAR